MSKGYLCNGRKREFGLSGWLFIRGGRKTDLFAKFVLYREGFIRRYYQDSKGVRC